MKRLSSPWIACLAALLLSGCASQYIRTGKEAYNDLRYHDAIWSLEKGLSGRKDDPEARRMLAESYFMINDMEKAAEVMERVAVYTDNTDEVRLRQGQTLMATGRYAEARGVFEGILSRDPDNKVAQAMLQSCRKLDELKRDSLFLVVEQVNIPMSGPVYSAFPFNNGLILTSPAAKGDADPYTDKAFTDLYFTRKEGQGWSSPQPLTEINGPYHDAVAAVSPSGQLMLFTRSFQLEGGKLAGNDSNVSNTQLYQSRRNADGTWSAPELVPFSTQRFMFAHPAFSADGQTVYFSSDMNGSGGMDIFSAQYNNGNWAAPQNLGTTINTPGNEVFPSMKGNDKLYFSSDGHNTLGGLDILSSNLINGTWSIPTHVSYPVNTAADDFDMEWNADGITGYFTSDRTGQDRIYSFAEIEPIIQFEGLVLGKDSSLPLGGARVTIVNLTDGTEKTVFTDGNGRYSTELEVGKDYQIKTELEGYFATTEQQSTKGVLVDKKIQHVTELKELYLDEASKNQDAGKDETGPDKKGAGAADKAVYPIPNIYWDYNKWDIRSDAIPFLDELVKLFRDNQNLKFELRSHCDSRGSHAYNDDLSAKRAKAVVDYLVTKGVPRAIIVSKGFGERQLVNGCSDGVFCTEDQHQENRRTEFTVTDKKK